MSTFTIKQPGDIPLVVSNLLGFHPTDSVVVVGLGGPTARVDLADNPLGAVEAIAAAEEHWTNGVVLAVYSADPNDLAVTLAAFGLVMPSIQVAKAVRVHDGLVHADGDIVPARFESAGTVFAGRTVAASRTDVAATANEVTDPTVALERAMNAYMEGDGASAWVFHDRYVALVGADQYSQTIAHLLTNAIDPKALAAWTKED